MKKGTKYFLMFTFGILLLPVALVAFWIYVTYRVVKYLYEEKNNHTDIRGFLNNTKNIIVSALAIVCIVFVPIGLVTFTKDYIENETIRQEQSALEEKQEEEELEQKKYENARSKVLDPRYRIKKEIDKVESVDETCILTEEEIEEYSITEEEINKFEKDREIAIIEYKDNKTVDRLRDRAEDYISDSTTSSINRFINYE